MSVVPRGWYAGLRTRICRRGHSSATAGRGKTQQGYSFSELWTSGRRRDGRTGRAMTLADKLRRHVGRFSCTRSRAPTRRRRVGFGCAVCTALHSATAMTRVVFPAIHFTANEPPCSTRREHSATAGGRRLQNPACADGHSPVRQRDKKPSATGIPRAALGQAQGWFGEISTP